MNFLAKNFVYVTKPFGRFLDEIAQGSQQYLRSLSSEQPSERPAQLTVDFPELAADFQLPPELEFVSHNIHSSPLRISGPVTMWLHYDVSSCLGSQTCSLIHCGVGYGKRPLSNTGF